MPQAAKDLSKESIKNPQSRSTSNKSFRLVGLDAAQSNSAQHKQKRERDLEVFGHGFFRYSRRIKLSRRVWVPEC